MMDLKVWPNKFKSCFHADCLIHKIDSLNQTSIEKKVDIIAIKKAIYYAKKYHDKQMRQSGEPYYSHPLIVAGMVADYCFKTDILVTAILHDTIEDTNLTKDMIIYIFDINIANKVEDLTRIKPYGKVTAAEMVKLLWSEKKHDLLLIKYFDRLHNLQTIHAKSPVKIQKIIQETLHQFISLGLYFEKNNMPDLMSKEHMNMVHLCLKQLPKKPYGLKNIKPQPKKNFTFEWLELFSKLKFIECKLNFLKF